MMSRENLKVSWGFGKGVNLTNYIRINTWTGMILSSAVFIFALNILVLPLVLNISISEIISFKFAVYILPMGIKSDSQHCIFKMENSNIFSNLTLSDLIFSIHSYRRQLMAWGRIYPVGGQFVSKQSFRQQIMAWGRTHHIMSNHSCEIGASEYPFPAEDTTPVINAMMATLVLTSIGWFIYNFHLRKVNINCTCWRIVEDFLNKSLTVILFIFNILNLTSIAVTETVKAMDIDWFLNKKYSSSANVTFITWISLSILNAIFSSTLVYGIRRRKPFIIKIYLLWADTLFVIWVVNVLIFCFVPGIFDQIGLSGIWNIFLAMLLINMSILLYVHFVGNVVIFYSIILEEKKENALEMIESAQSNGVPVIPEETNNDQQKVETSGQSGINNAGRRMTNGIRIVDDSCNGIEVVAEIANVIDGIS